MRRASGYGSRTGWRLLFDLDAWIRVLLFLTFAVVSMSALACAVALARDTTGHDWYASGKLTVADLPIGFLFDDSAPTEYRNWRGEVLSLTHAELRNNADALFARRHVLRTARKAAELGACCGFGGALLCLVLFRRQDRRWPQRAVRERVSGQPVPRQPASSAPARKPPVRAPNSETRRVPEAEPARQDDSEKGAGKSGGRSKDRPSRRKRDYGRWI